MGEWGFRQVGRRIRGPLKGKLFSLSFNRDCGADSHTHTQTKKMLTGHLQEAAEQDNTRTHTLQQEARPHVCVCACE